MAGPGALQGPGTLRWQGPGPRSLARAPGPKHYYPHRACRQAHGRVRAVLVLLVFAEILDGFCADNCSANPVEGNLLTSGGILGPRAPRTFDLHFCIVFRDDFLHGFSMHF